MANIAKLAAEGLVPSMWSFDWTGRRNVLRVSVAETADAANRGQALFEAGEPAIVGRIAGIIDGAPGIILGFGGRSNCGDGANC